MNIVHKIQPVSHEKLDEFAERLKSGEIDRAIIVYEIGDGRYLQPLSDSYYNELGWMLFSAATYLVDKEQEVYEEDGDT